ncbi:MAG: four-carbon acid sugar kinase family protein [SAR324 cluster bacterium]
MDPLGILADDLTGACDCAAPFAARGARTAVWVRPGAALPSHFRFAAELNLGLAAELDLGLTQAFGRLGRPRAWDVLAFNTDSRNVTEAEARSRVRSAALALSQAGWPLGFKKVDSTLRGHLSAELEELLALGVSRAWLAPAFPAQGRTVEDGRLLVKGVPLEATELSRDGLTPIASGRIAAALGMPCEPIGHLPLALYAQGAAALAHHVRFDRARDCRVTVCDAGEQAHLALLARLLKAPEMAAPRELMVGSAGLARELARVLLPAGDSPAAAPTDPPPVPRGIVLAVAGSRQRVTRAQVDRLAQMPGARRIELDPAAIGAGEHTARVLDEALARMRTGQSEGARVLVVTVGGGAGNGPEGGDLAARARDIREALGRLTARAVAALAPGGLVLTGGDVALAALNALEVEWLAVDGEAAPGIARAHIADGVRRGLAVVTKAGGFGDDETLVAVSLALGA